MHFYKNKYSKSNNYKIIYKINFFFLIFMALFMIDQINFPAPNKKIEKLLPNENLKSLSKNLLFIFY